MGASPALVCPDENLLVSLIEGRLEEDAVRALESHIDTCPSCESVVGELALVMSPAPDPATAPANDVSIGRYQILGEVGAGAMGVVYAAFDASLGRKVALKLLRPDLYGSSHLAAARARLLREARLLAGLSHPNVLPVYEAGAFGDQVYIAVELIEGSSLAAWQDAPRGFRAIVDVYGQAARGLAAAHEAGLVHRDVKPANVMLGDDGRVRVMDFGLATAGQAGAETSGLRPSSRADTALRTASGAIVGTPAYMAPEQFAGRRVDARSDQFSFAVALAEALTGERPLAGATAQDLEESIAPGHPPVPHPLLEVIARGLRPRPADRWPDMTALGRALDDALALGDAAPARAEAPLLVTTPPPRDLPETRGRPWPMMAVGLLTVGVLGLGLAARSHWRTGVVAPTSRLDSAIEPAPNVLPEPSAPASATPNPTVGDATPDEPSKSAHVRAAPAPSAASSALSSAPSAASSRDDIDFAIDVERAHDGGDAKGCIAAFAKILQERPALATRPDLVIDRAQCEQMAGDCAAGRKHLAALLSKTTPAAGLDTAVDGSSLAACRISKSSALDSDEGQRKIQALQKLVTDVTAARAAHDTAKCRGIGSELDDLVTKEKVGAQPELKGLAAAVSSTVAMCLSDGGDPAGCKAAKARFAKQYQTLYPELVARGVDDAALDTMFHQSFPSCP